MPILLKQVEIGPAASSSLRFAKRTFWSPRPIEFENETFSSQQVQGALLPRCQSRCGGYGALMNASTGLSNPRERLTGSAFQRSGRYNVTFMLGIVYAAVAYVRNPVGIFVEEMRRELHPAHTHADAHLTVLPPRPLRGTEEQALSVMKEVCQTVPEFEVTMGDVESFAPITPTVFLRVARGAYRMRELHDLLNRSALDYQEPWPYMPHLTVVKADTVEEADKVEQIARERWQSYTGPRTVRIDSLTFVKGNGERWVDLATVPLGHAPARPSAG